MSVLEMKSELENISNKFENLLNKAKGSQERLEIFSTYYKMLILIEKMKIDDIKGKKK